MKAEMNFDNIGGGGTVEYKVWGTLSSNPNTTKNKIVLGFKPKKLLIRTSYNGSQQWDMVGVYDKSVSASSYDYYVTSGTSTFPKATQETLPNSIDSRPITSIDNDGFTMGVDNISRAYNITFMAVG